MSKTRPDAGIPADRLIVVEIEPTMVRHLRQVLPGVTVIGMEELAAAGSQRVFAS